MKVSRWGNSLAIRIPVTVVEALKLEEGDDVEIHVVDARTFALTKKSSVDALLERLRAFRGRLPTGFQFDWDESDAC